MTELMHDLLTLDDLDRMPILSRGFYQRPTTEVARDLLGKILVRKAGDGTVAVEIVEVEAYLGIDDPACHTYGGRRTARTETMWGEAGHAYVYLIYGVHHCLNVVTVGEGSPEAVLIRGARPLAGGALIRRRRGAGVTGAALTDGPGKLCQALAVTRVDDGVDLSLCGAAMSIRRDPAAGSVRFRTTSRIGVEYAGDAAQWPLRFVVDRSARRSLQSPQHD
jgi:DNA-3-methyladenine glycosylase